MLDAVRAGVVDRVGDGLLDDLDAPQLACPRGQGQAHGADAAVQVVEALPALERRELAGDAVEPLGHLGVRLEERLRRDREAQPRDLLVDALVARQEHRAPAARGLADAVGPASTAGCRRGRPRRASTSISPGPVTRRTSISPVRRPSRTTRLRSSPVCVAAVEGVEALRARPGEHGLARLVAALGGEQAVRDADDLLPRAGRVEAADEPPAASVAEGVLELVAVAPLLDRGDDGVEHVASRWPMRAARRRPAACLISIWRSYGRTCHGAPGWSATSGMRSGEGSSTSVRARLGVRALALRDDGADAVAGDAAAHEDDVAVQPRDAVAAVGEVVDAEVQLGAALGARRGGGRRGHGSEARSHSSSAFWACRRFSAWSQMRWRSP